MFLLYRVNTNDVRGFRYLTKTKWFTELKLMPLEGEHFTVACGRSDITPTMATRSTTVDMTVKW
jgi:hypothetical protein